MRVLAMAAAWLIVLALAYAGGYCAGRVKRGGS